MRIGRIAISFSLHGRAVELAQSRGGFLDRYDDRLTRGPHANLDLSVGQGPSDHEAEGNAHQLEVLELHPGAHLAPIIDEDIQSRYVELIPPGTRR